MRRLTGSDRAQSVILRRQGSARLLVVELCCEHAVGEPQEILELTTSLTMDHVIPPLKSTFLSWNSHRENWLLVSHCVPDIIPTYNYQVSLSEDDRYCDQIIYIVYHYVKIVYC